MNMERLMKIKEASEYLGVHSSTLRRWEEQGCIVPIRIGKRGDRRYTATMLKTLINNYNNK